VNLPHLARRAVDRGHRVVLEHASAPDRASVRCLICGARYRTDDLIPPCSGKTVRVEIRESAHRTQARGS